MTYRKIYLNEVATVALDLSKSGAVVVVVEHQGRDAQHHMISASYLWFQLNFGGLRSTKNWNKWTKIPQNHGLRNLGSQ